VVDLRDEELYGKHADELIRFATTLVGPSAAEDIVASAVMRSMSSPLWRSVAEPRAYLFKAVLNEARSSGRAEQRRRRREERAASTEDIETSSVSLEVRTAVAALSLRERSVIYLAYWHDLPIDEIARTLGLTRRTAERALTSGRRTLEERLS
jgi:RNA polymerase sigma-70 factor (ECF subfamily)